MQCCAGSRSVASPDIAPRRAGQVAAERVRRALQRPVPQECLNEHLFSSLHAARQIFETWRGNYNTARLHPCLKAGTPAALPIRPGSGQIINRL
ncbi:integrase core domain-containing protein [Falsiroseomonas sp. E2-1-a4]|uniref:integrase core domain-containing protein n=1 Tax=Falsiroseomonas sp. E2-1-a4 TaxID=3239299 RepID=UPI003F405CE8